MNGNRISNKISALAFICSGAFCLLFSNQLPAAPLKISETVQEQNISSHLEYIRDKNKSLSFTEIRKNNGLKWRQTDAAYVEHGYVKDVMWVRFTIRNTSTRAQPFILEEASTLTDHLSLYVPHEKESWKIIRMGDARSYRERLYDHRTYAFPLHIPAGQSRTYYLRYETSDILALSLKVRSDKNFEAYRNNENAIMWMYYGLLLVMLVYNAFVLMSVRKLSYVFYLIYLSSLGMAIMTANGHSFQYLWPNSTDFNRMVLPFLNCLGLATLALFIRYFIETWKFNKVPDYIILGISAFSFMGAVFCLFTPDTQETLKWVVLLGGIIGATFTILMFYYTFIVKSRAAIFLLAAFLCLMIGGIAVALRVAQILPRSFISIYGVQMGSALEIVLLSLGLADRINSMGAMKDKAESKFRHIVESSNEMVFSMDKNFNFLMLNSALNRHLGHKPELLIGRNFLELIYVGADKQRNFSQNFVQEFLNELDSENQTVSFNANFAARYNLEPAPFSIHLELIHFRGEVEILGKAAPIKEDALFNFFSSEKQVYYINNYMGNADLLSHRLTKYLTKYLPLPEVQSLRIALREILINSIEHGNLSVSFEEKSRALEQGDYFQVLQARRNHPENRHKKIKIESSLNKDRIVFKITDEGDGFEHVKFLRQAAEYARTGGLLHGRGLLMSQGVFDRMRYNARGNAVTLVRYFSDSKRLPGPAFLDEGEARSAPDILSPRTYRS